MDKRSERGRERLVGKGLGLAWCWFDGHRPGRHLLDEVRGREGRWEGRSEGGGRSWWGKGLALLGVCSMGVNSIVVNLESSREDLRKYSNPKFLTQNA